MQIVIDISEDLYKATVNGLDANEIWDLRVAIKNGTLLSKGHGKIIDESQITEVYTDETEPVKINGMTAIPTRIVFAGTNAPTIIEADVESEG